MRTRYLYLALAFAATLAACDDDDPMLVEENEEELITRTTVVLTAGTDVVTFSLVDPDGDGGVDAVTTGGSLAAGTTYSYVATFLNETEDPAEDITEEVNAEDEEHQIFISFDGIDAAVTEQDEDDNGRPLGVTGRIRVADDASGSGTMNFTLVHEPNKEADGVADGDITNAGGETDVAAVFPVTIR